MKTKYTPISCDFYDHIEIFAMRKEVVDIQYFDEDDQLSRLKSRILDTKVLNREEFIILENDLVIRMDKIVQLNDIIMPQPGEGWSCY